MREITVSNDSHRFYCFARRVKEKWWISIMARVFFVRFLFKEMVCACLRTPKAAISTHLCVFVCAKSPLICTIRNVEIKEKDEKNSTLAHIHHPHYRVLLVKWDTHIQARCMRINIRNRSLTHFHKTHRKPPLRLCKVLWFHILLSGRTSNATTFCRCCSCCCLECTDP